jgi:predicted outer membrane protein
MNPIIRAASILLAAVVMVLTGPIAIAQAGTPAHRDDHGVSQQDRKFLRQVHQANLAEIKTGKLAKEKGKSDEVRELGRLFVKDHAKLDAGLVEVADDLGVHLPSQPNRKQKAIAEKLADLSGAKFDAAWVDAQIKAHEEAVALTEKEIKHGSNDDVIRLAEKAAPVIKHHLQLLRDIEDDHDPA